MASGHISMYELTIENGTPFAKLKQSSPELFCTDDQLADLHLAAESEAASAGFEHYQISNYAKPNHRAIHNSGYWLGYDYIGVGPGAHGRYLDISGERVRTVQHPEPKRWVASTAWTRIYLYAHRNI